MTRWLVEGRSCHKLLGLVVALAITRRRRNLGQRCAAPLRCGIAAQNLSRRFTNQDSPRRARHQRNSRSKKTHRDAADAIKPHRDAADTIKNTPRRRRRAAARKSPRSVDAPPREPTATQAQQKCRSAWASTASAALAASSCARRDAANSRNARSCRWKRGCAWSSKACWRARRQVRQRKTAGLTGFLKARPSAFALIHSRLRRRYQTIRVSASGICMSGGL